MTPIYISKIRMIFYVPLFLNACDVYKSLEPGEYSNETLVCDFLRKHIFRTLIEQAEEVEKEHQNSDSSDSRHWKFIAGRMKSAFGACSKSVRQNRTSDNMVHVEMTMYSPMHKNKQLEHKDIVRWVQQNILMPIRALSSDLAEQNKVHGEIYASFAQEIARIIKGNDQFVSCTVEQIER